MPVDGRSSDGGRWAPARFGCCRCRSSRRDPPIGGQPSSTASARTVRFDRRRTKQPGSSFCSFPRDSVTGRTAGPAMLMSDGVSCPNLHDGMAVVDEWHSVDDAASSQDDGDETSFRSGSTRDGDQRHEDGDRRHRSSRIVLVRNHEGDAGPVYVLGPTRHHLRDPWKSHRQRRNHQSRVRHPARRMAIGLVQSRRHGPQLRRRRDALGHVAHVRRDRRWRATAGTFDVGHRKGNTTPLVDMGRFSHEAVMVDPRTGYVYETEDAGNCGFYRFIPYRRGRLDQGGRLYMLAVSQPAESRSRHVLADRDDAGTSKWVAHRRPARPPRTPCYAQGHAKGGARLQPARGRMVGRPDGLLPLDQRRQRGRGTGVRIRPPRRDADS